MRKVFIDCGAYTGDTIELFKKGEIVKRDDLNEFEIFAFDPASDHPDVIKKAVSTFDGQAVFSFNLDRDMASTIEPKSLRFDNIGKLTEPLYTTEKRIVEVISLPKWICQFKKEDYVILKLDIEGSEFDILEEMIQSKTIELVDELFVEFHSFNMPEGYLEWEGNLKWKLAELGVPAKAWTLYD